MTIEEAIKELEFLASCSYVDEFESTETEALNMAIGVLKRLDRIKVLMDASGETIEEMLARSATYSVNCEKCPISKLCVNVGSKVNKKTGLLYGCGDVWEDYLKGEEDD